MSATLASIQQDSNRIVREIFPHMPPPPLYHYTSGEGLLGILRAGQLRASNFVFMNDRSEFLYVWDLLRQIAASQLKEDLRPSQHRFLELLMEQLDVDVDLYLTCFCEKGYLLSQWRGYGSQDSRFCIELDVRQFVPAIDAAASPVGPVIYNRARQEHMLTQVLRCHMDPIPDLDLNEETTAGLSAMAKCVYRCCLPLFAFFKDEAFGGELEWRAVLLADPDKHARLLDFTSGYLKPSLPLAKGSDGRLPVRKIIAGATRTPAQAVKAARLLLARYDYSAVEVVASKIPLSG